MQPQVYSTTEPSTIEAVDKTGMEEVNGCTRNSHDFTCYTLRGQQFVVPQRYRVENCIGHGAYGIVGYVYYQKKRFLNLSKKIFWLRVQI